MLWHENLVCEIFKEEPCSIWDDVEVSPANVRVTPLKHSHLCFGWRSNQITQLNVLCLWNDQSIERAIDVLPPEFSIWGRFYVQPVLGKSKNIIYRLQLIFIPKYNFAKEFCLKFKLSATVSMILASHPPFRPSNVVYVNGVRLKLVALGKNISFPIVLLLESNNLDTDLKVRPPRSSSCSEKKPLNEQVFIFNKSKNLCSSILVPVHMSYGPLQKICFFLAMTFS